MDTALRPMSTSRVLDRTFQLYRRHLLLFAGIAMPTAIIRLILKLVEPTFSGKGGRYGPVDVALALAYGVAFLVGEAIASGATVFAVSAVHLGRPITILKAYGKLTGSFGRILRTVALFNVKALGVALAGLVIMISGYSSNIGWLITAGIVIMIVGGLVALSAYGRYSLSVPACVVEMLPARKALERSEFLSTDRTYRVWFIYIFTWIIGWMVSGVFHAPEQLINGFSHIVPQTALWNALIDVATSLLVNPITVIFLALFYYDQRVRKEAFDLDLMIGALEQKDSPNKAEAQTTSH